MVHATTFNLQYGVKLRQHKGLCGNDSGARGAEKRGGSFNFFSSQNLILLFSKKLLGQYSTVNVPVCLLILALSYYLVPRRIFWSFPVAVMTWTLTWTLHTRRMLIIKPPVCAFKVSLFSRPRWDHSHDVTGVICSDLTKLCQSHRSHFTTVLTGWKLLVTGILTLMCKIGGVPL